MSAPEPAVAAFHGDGFPRQASTTRRGRIQAGAFGDEDNARKAVAQLAVAGTATIEPIERGGHTLYRVTLPGPADEAEAYALRDKVAGIGLADARVVRRRSSRFRCRHLNRTRRVDFPESRARRTGEPASTSP